MKYLSRDEIKKKGIARFFRSIKFSIEGLIYAYRYEQSIWVHAIATVFTIILGLFCIIIVCNNCPTAATKVDAVCLCTTVYEYANFAPLIRFII